MWRGTQVPQTAQVSDAGAGPRHCPGPVTVAAPATLAQWTTGCGPRPVAGVAELEPRRRAAGTAGRDPHEGRLADLGDFEPARQVSQNQ